MGLPKVRRPDPDRIILARLSGAVSRHSRKGTPEEEAVAELRVIAGNRPDLLGHEAGIALGAIATAGHPPWRQREMELLIAAGADLAVIPRIAAETAVRLREARDHNIQAARRNLPQ